MALRSTQMRAPITINGGVWWWHLHACARRGVGGGGEGLAGVVGDGVSWPRPGGVGEQHGQSRGEETMHALHRLRMGAAP